MEYSHIVTMRKKNKTISFFLEKGNELSWENIIDVEIYDPNKDLKGTMLEEYEEKLIELLR
jgi:hypothetical protein